MYLVSSLEKSLRWYFQAVDHFWEEPPGFYYYLKKLLSVSLKQILARSSFAIDYPGWDGEFKISI